MVVSLSTIQSQQVTAMPQAIKQPEVSAVISSQVNEAQLAKEGDKLAEAQIKPVESSDGSGHTITYSYNEDIHGVVIKVLSEDKKVLRQIPPEEAIKQYKVIDELLSKLNSDNSKWG